MFIETKAKPPEPENRHPLDCLSRLSKLQWILHKSEQIKTVNAWLEQILPQKLAPHCNCIAVHPQYLTMSVSNAAWAHNLRLQSNTIISALKQKSSEHSGLVRLKIKVR